ncbi:MAG TPA: ABC transporter ATP-binding protein [Patescibacteria group bacterium]|nr:ABC transporter ATP-binding protein [Patescibacteria group bacterium]
MSKEFKEILIGIRRAISLLSAREKRSLYIATGLMLIIGILTNLPAVILGKLVDTLTGTKTIDFSLVTPFVTFIVVIILIRESLNVVRKYLIENIATQIDKEQTVELIGRLLKTDIRGFLQDQQIGALHGRIFRSMQGLIWIIKLTFNEFAPIFFSALAAIAIALYQKPLIATIMVLVIPSGLYLIVKQVSSQKGIRVALLRGKEKVDGKVVEMLSGIETIRVLDTVDYEMQKVEVITEQQRKIEIRHHIYMALFDAAKYLNEGFFYIFVIVLSIFLASKGIITKGDILVYSILFLSITGPLREIHRILDQTHENSIRVNDLYGMLHEPIDEAYKNGRETQSLENVSEIVRTKDLSFSYGNETGGLLDKINIHIKQGQSIGIAGASGCGKTTFIHILLKLIHGYKGDVLLFGEDLRDIGRNEIAQKIAYVPQSPFIFSGTIRENITYGVQRNTTEEDIVHAAKQAHIYDEILKSLGGLEGKVTEAGGNLSGGQRQRLAIARVMLSSAELLIFDEATSALDNTNEAIIQENIEKQFKDKTIITIAHRLTTLKNSDKILVFDRGKVAQEGSFKELSSKKGLFQDFLLQKAERNQN